jgi:ammonia channel protein AmtB
MKNLIEGCITAIVWWCWGFGTGFGNVSTNNKGFVGNDYFLAIN